MHLKREDAVYAEGFRFSQEGHAVWPKILSNEMKPGACGYFNGYGDWVTIVQLTDVEAVQELISSTPAATTETTPKSVVKVKITDIDGSTDWSEKKSEKVRRQALDLEGAFM